VYTRKRLRLRRFDYSTEAIYFVTVCTHGRGCFLGHIDGDVMSLGQLGRIVETQLERLPGRMIGVDVDRHVVMPNHVHAIVGLRPRARQASPLRLGHVVAAFKSGSTREINLARKTPGAHLWQRGYYDHVVRDETDLQRIREYIDNNPLDWALDPENPTRES
jgi:putative transposase